MAIEQVDTGAQEVNPLISALEAPEIETTATEGNQEAGDTTNATGTIDNATAEVVEKIEQAQTEGATKEELNELRGMLRTLRNENIGLQARLNAAERVQKGEFGSDGKEIAPSDLEVYQQQLTAAQNRDFSQILAVMEVNPKYEDLNSVCSTSNVSDVFESVASHRSAQNGTDFNIELLKVQAEVWSTPNPYKVLYETIKEYHPKYAAPAGESTKKDEPAKPADTSAKGILNAAKAPGSIADLAGGGTNAVGGWTASRIDALPESELHTVPKDIYKKWLSGELD